MPMITPMKEPTPVRDAFRMVCTLGVILAPLAVASVGRKALGIEVGAAGALLLVALGFWLAVLIWGRR